ncbi:RNA polymerase sigma-70 factor, ECF subfamily [Gordonia malaquae]|uniref:sigma-70 family RNA polymerase sigma factor n=1 Tax=Gordonia malaquae TaxID=410332 RepID=UPI00089D0C11|nr:sigma-70 family RNA polymerase sigma factor [Gordonia malaquae]SEC20240.1 RNA polymerase sigma-70 factor, ECF subfamily [Gordonia malaquae]
MRTVEVQPEELLEAVATGDRDAYATLFDALAPRNLALARRVVASASLAEEVVQDAWLQVWRDAASFDRSRGSATAWVTTLVHRRAVDTVRHDSAANRRDIAYEAARPSGHDTVSEAAVDRDETRRVRRCLDGLTGRQREAIDLAYFGGRTYAEVAAVLAVNPATVKTRIRDGLQRLRTCMGGL